MEIICIFSILQCDIIHFYILGDGLNTFQRDIIHFYILDDGLKTKVDPITKVENLSFFKDFVNGYLRSIIKEY